jgi:hypothetical protein
MLGTLRWPAVIEAPARVRIEDWSGALDLLERSFQRPQVMILTPMAYDYLRSLACSHLGRTDQARSYYDRATVEWDAETGTDPLAWERSDAMRWRREAEAALVK